MTMGSALKPPPLNLDMIRGAVVGTIVGDAFGSVLEGIVPDEAVRRARTAPTHGSLGATPTMAQ